MRYGRDQRLFFRPDRKYFFHKRHFIRDFEIFPDICYKYGWSEWTKAFPSLDLAVQQILGITASRIGKDRSCAQGPGTEFRAAIEPPHDSGVDQPIRYYLIQFF